ncbi:acetolactate synthase small subunit, partial [Francisella tularensis]|uniref:acetolactate synthase small subunit n=1 Tax=Francisella tularensis TaxID=263 RepID=UPI002381D01D
ENTLCVLHRISSVLSRNRKNIEQLTVFETANKCISHFNLVVHSTQDKIEKIVRKLAIVIEVIDISITNCLPMQGTVVSEVPQNVNTA